MASLWQGSLHRRPNPGGVNARVAVHLLVPSGFFAALAEALDEAHWRADEGELGAQLVFEEAFVAEVQRLLLVGEDEERGRRRLCLGDVVDAYRTRFRSGAALQIDLFLEP